MEGNASGRRGSGPVDRYLRDQATRGVALLSIRQALVGVVTVTGIIVLPLLLGPADFSLYGYVNMIVLLGATVGDLGLGAYLIKHEVSNRKLRGMLGLQLVFWISFGLLLFAFLRAFDPFGFGNVTYALLCGGLVLFSLQALPTALMEKRLAFRRISFLEVTQRLILVALAILLAIFEPLEWAIPLAALASASALYPIFLWLSDWPGLPTLTRGEPLFSGFASEWWQTRIANLLAYAVYPILGGLLLTPTEVGLLIWALSISLVPGYMAPMAARAIYPLLARASRKERGELHELILRALLFFGTPLAVFLFIIAPAGTQVLFGMPWTDAVPSLRILLVVSLIGVCVSTALPHVFLSSKPTTVKWLCFFSVGLLFCSVFFLTPFFGLDAIPIAALGYGVLLWIEFDLLLRKSDAFSPIPIAAPAFIGLIVTVLIVMLIPHQINNEPWLVALIAIGGVILQTSVTNLLGGGISPRQFRRMLTRLRSSREH